MGIIYRQGHNGRLSIEEMDNNFHFIEDSLNGLSSLESGLSASLTALTALEHLDVAGLTASVLNLSTNLASATASILGLSMSIDNISLTPGPIGATGPQGPIGATGPQGPIGATGPVSIKYDRVLPSSGTTYSVTKQGIIFNLNAFGPVSDVTITMPSSPNDGDIVYILCGSNSDFGMTNLHFTAGLNDIVNAPTEFSSTKTKWASFVFEATDSIWFRFN